MRIGRTRNRSLLALAAAFGAAALVAGCGGSDTHQSRPSAQVLGQAADASSAAAGYRMGMVIQENVAGQTINATANGSFSPASKSGEMTMNMNVDSTPLQIKVVFHGDVMYMKFPASVASELPGGRSWIYMNLSQLGRADGEPALGSLFKQGESMDAPTQYLDYLHAASSGTVQDLGSASVNGVATTHYRADLELSKMASAVPPSERAATRELVAELKQKGANLRGAMPIEAWIDSAHLIRRIKLRYSISIDGKKVSIAMTMNMLDYGPQPTPTLPSPNQAENLLTLVKDEKS